MQQDEAYAFRRWNPEKIENGDNRAEERVGCPSFFICCSLTEKLFKEGFKEVIDAIEEE